MRRRAAWRRRGVWLSGVLVLVAAVSSSAGQSTSTGIRVVPPLDGATLEPGLPVTVVVEPEGPTPLREVVIITRGVAQRMLAPPFQFTFRPPQELGAKQLVIAAQDQRNKEFFLELTYHVEVETATRVTTIRVTTPTLFIATERAISVSGTFTDGVTRDITRSREIRYTSSNPQVATVSPQGLIEAVNPGTATITVEYKDKSVTVAVTVKFEKLNVPLDIEPDSRRNTIHLGSGGEVRVAILSTEAFDAMEVNPETVRFGPGQAPPLAEDNDDDDDEEDERDSRRKHTGRRSKPKHHEKDTNGDGRPDLLLQFSIPATGLTCADTQATLTGVTFSGDRISGSDTIRVVGKACR